MTQLTYLTNATLQTSSATVKSVQEIEGLTAITLDQTIFYPQGGGQPADHGSITGPNGSLLVTHVSYNSGDVQHKGKLQGSISPGDNVQLQVEWSRRLYHCQLHTAGHILDQAIKDVCPGIYATDGNHGINQKSYLELSAEIDPSLAKNIQNRANQIISENHPISFEMLTKAQMEQRDIKLPFDLPTNKPLRIMQIGTFPPMPDGGTHLESTGTCWPITVTEIKPKKGAWRISYSVNNPDTKTANTQNASPETLLSLQHLKQQVEQLKHQVAQDLDQSHPLTALKTKYLGKKGLFNREVASLLSQVDPGDRKAAGQTINELKNHLETVLSAEKTPTTAQWVDLTIPGLQPPQGHLHPVSQAMEEITTIFEQIGFTRVRYPEVDWDWYVFESLNMPPNHPARDEWETFFIDLPDTTQAVPYDAEQPRQRHPSLVGGKVVLTAHTSNGQVREMERLNSQPPIRMINIARCYRRQQDATHTQMFHQFEGLVVDKGINIQHLKGTLDHFAQEFYGAGTKSRIRPFHFQFTEPSFEVDFSCHICHGTGQVDNQKCKFCKSGWHEVGGAGMVHPNVLKAGGIDPDVYTGFAFGWGIERTYTLREGLKLDDIRLLYSADLRFLEQF